MQVVLSVASQFVRRSNRGFRHLCSIPLFALCLVPAGGQQAQPAPTSSASQLKARAEYSELLARVQQGDMSVDFRAFRIAGAIAAGPSISVAEAADRATFKKFMAASNPQGALDFSNRTLDLDYADAVAHFDAMMACRALNQPAAVTAHEKLLIALLDSITRDGDGKTPETSYLAVATQEEYIFMALRLNVKPRAQSLITQNGHFYDRIEVLEPKSNTTQYVWFNADIQMNPDGFAAPGPTGNSKEVSAPVVLATAQRIAPTPTVQNGPGPQVSGSTSPPPATNLPPGSAAGLGFGPLNQDRPEDIGLYKIGGNVSAPVALNMVTADFSEEARRAKYQGVCLISMIVDVHGKPQNPRVIRTLGMGLDQKALEAVSKYKFKPAMKDGKTPVPVMITVEVDFRLVPRAH